MFGHLPNISDIRGSTPDASTWSTLPTLSHPAGSSVATKYHSQQALFTHRPQAVQNQGQSQHWYYRNRSAEAQQVPKNKAHSPPALLTPDDTPPEAFYLQLPDTDSHAHNTHSTVQSQVKVIGEGSQSTTAFNTGLGLFFDYFPGGEHPSSSVAGFGHSGLAQYSQAPYPQYQPYKWSSRPQVPLQLQQYPKQPVQHRDLVLVEVARWMNGPAHGLQIKAGLVYTMMAFDERLPRNPVYDASQYDEEDVDSDEE